jgi:hypothetical protein
MKGTSSQIDEASLFDANHFEGDVPGRGVSDQENRESSRKEYEPSAVELDIVNVAVELNRQIQMIPIDNGCGHASLSWIGVFKYTVSLPGAVVRELPLARERSDQ